MHRFELKNPLILLKIEKYIFQGTIVHIEGLKLLTIVEKITKKIENFFEKFPKIFTSNRFKIANNQEKDWLKAPKITKIP